jgi:DNA-binding NtrC family response regulator
VTDLPLPKKQETRPRLEQFVHSLENGWLQLQHDFKELERQLLERALAIYGDRPNGEIAKIIGTSRRILELRLQEYGLNKNRPKHALNKGVIN